MKPNYEQQARELAEKLAIKLTNTYGEAMCQNRKDETDTILRELNLAKLLEDAAMLDWLDKNRTAHIYNHFQYHPSTAASQRTWRTAIRNAMKEDEK